MIGAVGTGVGQLAPPSTGGVAALVNSLKAAGADKRVLMIGAHPDDEDTELLAIVSRGLGAQTAYLSLSRGEGGQNLIGPELGAALGVIRTEELLAARRLDGARQYFTRAYDFGFSKTAEESFRFWPRDSLLKDVLDVIRRFRPQVIVSIFSGTPRDGHGQHQVAGALARQAFTILKDSSWGPVKLYRSARFDSAGTTLTLQGGRLEPVTGQSYHQLAMAGRSRHRSQDMGQLQQPGPSAVRLALWERREGGRGTGDGDDLFAGVDTVLEGRQQYVALVDSARAALNPLHPEALVPLLARALAALGNGADLVDTEQRGLVSQALAAAAAVEIDAVADDWIVVGGQRLQVEASVWNGGTSGARVDEVQLAGPAGWAIERLDQSPGPLAGGGVATQRFVVTVPADAERSQPYFLRRPPLATPSLYNGSAVTPEVRGLPFEPPLLELHVRATIAGASITLTREVSYRYRDQADGEVRRPLLVDCAFDVALAPSTIVWPSSGPASAPRRFTVTVTNRTRGAAVAEVAWVAPRGWSAPPSTTLTFAYEDESKNETITLALPPTVPTGVVRFRAGAGRAGGRRCEDAAVIIDYPHIRPRAVVHPSVVEIHVARIALPVLTRVGYVRGAADRVPEALAAVGVPVEVLDADSLARGTLARYDAIVIGSRAYETDPALVANNGRILEYARGGGLVIVEYQQYPFVQGGFAPYPLTIARPHDRVTDETAPVTLLDPAAPVFHVPNEIGPADWQGWVQERGLYFAHAWDPAYTPLLEMHDPGEPPLRGGLLVSHVGKGTYVYTALAFFRELPAGVTGAYRLFANLLALRR
jgi:LmbE family N-acetylglucosaminyl deacetylase